MLILANVTQFEVKETAPFLELSGKLEYDFIKVYRNGLLLINGAYYYACVEDHRVESPADSYFLKGDHISVEYYKYFEHYTELKTTRPALPVTE